MPAWAPRTGTARHTPSWRCERLDPRGEGTHGRGVVMVTVAEPCARVGVVGGGAVMVVMPTRGVATVCGLAESASWLAVTVLLRGSGMATPGDSGRSYRGHTLTAAGLLVGVRRPLALASCRSTPRVVVARRTSPGGGVETLEVVALVGSHSGVQGGGCTTSTWGWCCGFGLDCFVLSVVLWWHS